MKEETRIVNEMFMQCKQMLNYCKQEVNRENIINTMFDYFGVEDE